MNDNLVERVERLERRNAFLFGCLVLVGLILAVTLFDSLATNRMIKRRHALTAESMRVNSLVAGSIEVVAPHGKNSISIGASEDGWAVISLRGLDGVQKAVLLLTPSGKPSLDFFSDKAARLTLGVVNSPDGQGEEFSLHLKDTNNRLIWHPDVGNPY